MFVYFCLAVTKYSSNFWLLCFSMFFFTTSYNLILPEMNTIISNLHGEMHKGWIIGLFTLSAGLSRPFSGKLADTVGRKKVMITGILFCGTMSLFYPMCVSVAFLLVLRFFHGFSTGFYPTGATALVTDIIPQEKRGVAMGIWGTANSLGIGVGQGLSTTSVNLFGQNGMFLCSFGLVLISYGLLWMADETLEKQERFKWSLLRIQPGDIIERNVIPVAVVMFMSSICSGIIFVLTPDISERLQMNNKGAFFVFYVVATIVVRLLSGGISDKVGRRQMLIFGISLMAVSMAMIGFANTPQLFITASVLFGVATGIASPTIFAWTADLSPENRRGIGAGTMYIALEFGIFSGSMITNAIYENKPENISLIFVVGTATLVGTVGYLFWHLVKRTSPS